MDLGGHPALPPSRYDGDIHCVTTWSKLGTSFAGVSVDDLLAAAGPTQEATHVVAWSHTGYTTNLPLEDVTGGRAWVVWEHEGAPLPVEHGGPARLLVPHLYFWKSPSGWAGCGCSTTTSRGSGRPGATTTAATPGSSSGTPVTDLPPLPSLPSLPPLPSIGPVTRRPPVGGARREWQTATVREIRRETARMVTLRLGLPHRRAARAGTARHRAADRARRLHRLPVLQHRVGAH